MEEEKKEENKAVSRAAEAYGLTAKKYLQISKHQANSIEEAPKRDVFSLICSFFEGFSKVGERNRRGFPGRFGQQVDSKRCGDKVRANNFALGSVNRGATKDATRFIDSFGEPAPNSSQAGGAHPRRGRLLRS